MGKGYIDEIGSRTYGPVVQKKREEQEKLQEDLNKLPEVDITEQIISNGPGIKKIEIEDKPHKCCGGGNCQSKKKEYARGSILFDAIVDINGKKQDAHGKPEDSFQIIADYWNVYLKHHQGALTKRSVAEMMVLFKEARMTGQNPSPDTLMDLAGYAGLASDFLQEEKDNKEKFNTEGRV